MKGIYMCIYIYFVNFLNSGGDCSGGSVGEFFLMVVLNCGWLLKIVGCIFFFWMCDFTIFLYFLGDKVVGIIGTVFGGYKSWICGIWGCFFWISRRSFNGGFYIYEIR